MADRTYPAFQHNLVLKYFRWWSTLASNVPGVKVVFAGPNIIFRVVLHHIAA